MRTYTFTLVLTSISISSAVLSERTDKRSVYKTVKIARSLEALDTIKPFCIHLTNVSKKLGHIPKLMMVAHVKNIPFCINAARAALLEKGSQTIGGVH